MIVVLMKPVPTATKEVNIKSLTLRITFSFLENNVAVCPLKHLSTSSIFRYLNSFKSELITLEIEARLTACCAQILFAVNKEAGQQPRN